jgi:hypothetical protein
MKHNITDLQDLGLTNKFLLPNVKKLDHPPTKKTRVAPPAPEVYVAVNIAPTVW